MPARCARPGRRSATGSPPACTVPLARQQAGERAQELALPVALDARQPDDLARAGRRGDVVEARPGEPAHAQQRLGVSAASVALGGNACSTERPMIRRRISASDTPAAANVPRVSPSRSTVMRSAMRLHLGQPVGDVDDRRPGRGDRRASARTAAALSARRQRLGRLVEHEHLRLECERLRDLESWRSAMLSSLTRADGSIVGADRPRASGAPRPARSQQRRPAPARHREDHVLGDRQVLEDREVLVHDGQPHRLCARRARAAP